MVSTSPVGPCVEIQLGRANWCWGHETFSSCYRYTLVEGHHRSAFKGLYGLFYSYQGTWRFSTRPHKWIIKVLYSRAKLCLFCETKITKYKRCNFFRYLPFSAMSHRLRLCPCCLFPAGCHCCSSFSSGRYINPQKLRRLLQKRTLETGREKDVVPSLTED